MDFIEKVNALPEKIKDFFTSNDVRLELEKSCLSFGIVDTNSIQTISGPIGLIFVSEINLSDLPNIILKNLRVPENIAYGIAYEINKRIFNRFPDYFKDSDALLSQWEKKKSAPLLSETEVQKKLIELEPWIAAEEKEKDEFKQKELEYLLRISLSEALKNFPELGEQIITAEALKLKSFPQPVRPSLKNWLADYSLTLGYEKHNAIDRSGYLFQNENTRRLNPEDRQKLVYLLKSLDENTPIMVNKATKRIIFPEYVPAATRTQMVQPMQDPEIIDRTKHIVNSPMFRPLPGTTPRPVISAAIPNRITSFAKPTPVVRPMPTINPQPRTIAPQPAANPAPIMRPIIRPATTAPVQTVHFASVPTEHRHSMESISQSTTSQKIDEVDMKDRNVKFSYAQKMPFEKKVTDNPDHTPMPNVRTAPFVKKTEKAARLLPNNVVNLKPEE